MSGLAHATRDNSSSEFEYTVKFGNCPGVGTRSRSGERPNETRKSESAERGQKSYELGFSVVRYAHLSCVPWISELVSETSYLPLRRVREWKPEGFQPEAGRKAQRRESSRELRDVKSRSAEG